MSNLLEKIRKARESVIEVAGFKFTIRRPTDVEAVEMKSVSLQYFVTRFVVGWEGVREIDILSNADPIPAEFSRELWEEWSADHPEFWEPITTAVIKAYSDHRGVAEDVEKN